MVINTYLDSLQFLYHSLLGIFANKCGLCLQWKCLVKGFLLYFALLERIIIYINYSLGPYINKIECSSVFISVWINNAVCNNLEFDLDTSFFAAGS